MATTSPAEPRWLDPGQQAVWRSWVAVVKSLDEVLDRQLQRDAHLTLADYVILMHLSEAPGRAMRMSELADATVYSRSRLSHAARRLEDLGWIQRTTCDEDGRGTLAHLTEAGFAVIAAAAPGHATAVHDLVFDAIGPRGTASLGQVLEALAARLASGPPQPLVTDETS
jgi:DNA-binding MarR family transcriptional regulator